jgi:hypothetical protein
MHHQLSEAWAFLVPVLNRLYFPPLMHDVPSSRRSRSSSPKPSLQPSRDYVAASSRASPGSSATLAVSSRPPSRLTALDRRANAFAGPSTPGRLINPQDPTDFGRNPLPAPHMLTPLGSSGPNLAQVTADAHSSYHNPGMFNHARDFTVAGSTFVDSSGEILSARLLCLP